MTKKDIVRRIADELDRPQIETVQIVQKTLDAIINVLAAEGRIELRNFGVFEVKKRKPRQGQESEDWREGHGRRKSDGDVQAWAGRRRKGSDGMRWWR